ncbi:MAG: hypothetical protein US36_C0010G0006 [Candidatus Wolfebacteria bacterium GW2011_GWC1_37_10]|uniref:Prepilin-type N-terminal cleavage/methylation domain-containing protein n=1 Tax=Candidatus Wolfebacteria bacterium GW2011_GWC1_37_10 TaxID=1619010 RepID=A0A0G0FVU3_9BACT|nr:MAG: hypothetical protein US36_C0010G0006 [Candidatus Wolfebacteria bacterium GW2011_GWC1_37_10]
MPTRYSLNSKFFSKGFSLLELIFYIGILAIVMLILGGIFISLNRGRGQAETYSEVNSNMLFIIEKISQDLRAASSSAAIIAPSSTSTATNTLTVVAGTSTVSYTTSTSGQLIRTVDGNSYPITSDMVNIDSLTFKRFENVNPIFGASAAFVSIEINIGMSYKSESPDYQYSQNKKTTISIRN